jgi:hypothetical protein
VITPKSVSDWIAWLALVIPLFILSATAVRYLLDRQAEMKCRRFEEFFTVTDKLGDTGGSIMSKVAAVYELRRFPEYADVITRMTDAPDIRGSGRPVELLVNEFQLTHEVMKKKIR